MPESIPSLSGEESLMQINESGNKSAFTLGINTPVIDKLSIGLSWTTKSSKELYMNYQHHSSMHSLKQSSSSLLFNVKYEWLKFWKLRLYSRAGIGAVFFSKPKLESGLNYQLDDFEWSDGKPKACTRFAWQASLVGVEYRPIKWVGVFVEGGLGRQGALLAGMKVFL